MLRYCRRTGAREVGPAGKECLKVGIAVPVIPSKGQYMSIFMSHKVSKTRVVIKKCCFMIFYEVKHSKMNIFGEHYVFF